MPNLTFKQKRDYQAQIDGKYAEMEAGTLSFKEKRTIQGQINEIYEVLGEGQNVEKTTLDHLIAGDFNSLSVDAFIKKLQDVKKETDEQIDDPIFKDLTVAVANYILPAHLQEFSKPEFLGLTQTDIEAEFGKAA